KLNGKPAVDPSRISLYDLVLLEYPHGAVPDESETGKAVVKDYLARAGMLRPIAYVRGDWFVDAVTRTPLYDDLLQLKGLISDLEKDLNVPQVNPVRGGVVSSREMAFPRVLERKSTNQRAYWRSHDLATGGRDALLRTAAGKGRKTSSMVLFSLP